MIKGISALITPPSLDPLGYLRSYSKMKLITYNNIFLVLRIRSLLEAYIHLIQPSICILPRQFLFLLTYYINNTLILLAGPLDYQKGNYSSSWRLEIIGFRKKDSS
jgi:hypothetical protein